MLIKCAAAPLVLAGATEPTRPLSTNWAILRRWRPLPPIQRRSPGRGTGEKDHRCPFSRGRDWYRHAALVGSLKPRNCVANKHHICLELRALGLLPLLVRNAQEIGGMVGNEKDGPIA